MTVTFSKTYNTPDDIVALLSKRGLTVNDKSNASDYIRNIGYYRLSGYLYPFLSTPKTAQMFKTDATLSKVLSVYRFDKKLRLFLFNEIEKIEISFRSALANIVAKETGDIFWMTNHKMFANQDRFRKTIDLIDKELDNSKEDFILHFKTKYSNPYPPAWILVEILPMGVVTRIYGNLKSNALKKLIAARYSLPVPVFVSWLTVITLTRNSCCHHARIWNRKYAVSPMLAKKWNRPWINAKFDLDKTFFEICIIKWFIDIISPNNDMKQHLIALLANYPNIDPCAMGFPIGWENEPLWK